VAKKRDAISRRGDALARKKWRISSDSSFLIQPQRGMFLVNRSIFLGNSVRVSGIKQTANDEKTPNHSA